MDQIEPELMALKANKGGKGGKRGKGGKGFQGNCNYRGKIRPLLERLNDVLFEGPRHQSQRRRTLEPKREEERGRKDWDFILTVSRSMLDRGRVAVQDGTQREEQKGRAWEGGTRKRLHRQGWSVLVWWSLSAGCLCDWRELKNSFAAGDERDPDDKITSVSVEDFPAISTETVFEKKSVPRV